MTDRACFYNLRHPGESRDPFFSLGKPLLELSPVSRWVPASAGMTDLSWSRANHNFMREEKVPAVYILASKIYGTLYIGVTSDLCSRISAHKEKLIPDFTKKYNVDRLVYVEFHNSMDEAIAREKQLKEWKRDWKIQLIEKDNPQWIDLYAELCGRYALPGEEMKRPK
jgi:putative endonuclease